MSTATKSKKRTSDGPVRLQPLGDRVVVEREEAEARTAGGIVLPDSAQDKPSRGVVVSVGEGRLLANGKRTPLQVKAGDRVLFSKWGGDAIKIGDRELTLMKEDDILAIIDG